jgi:putative ABC transport system substrate-binding protein
MPVIGFLRSTSANASADIVAALRRGLTEAGYTEGQNLAIEYRWAENQAERLPGLVADLIRRQCAVIIAGGDAAALAAKTATESIPIVFATGEDPVKFGLVASLNRPGGNLTGISFYNSGDLHSKQLQFLREVVPKGAVIGLLVNPTSPAAESDQREAAALRHVSRTSKRSHFVRGLRRRNRTLTRHQLAVGPRNGSLSFDMAGGTAINNFVKR